MADTPPTSHTPDSPADQVPASQFEQFLERNFKRIVSGLVLILAILLTLAMLRYNSRQTELTAATAFTSARTVEDCNVIIQKYAGTQAAGNAVLLKATLLWEAGKKESSISALQDFIKSQPAHDLAPYAEVALGSKQAALGAKDEAKKTLEGVVRDHPKSDVAAAAEVQLGDMLWAEGKIAEAKKVFSEFPRNYPGSPFISETEVRTKMMDAGLPTKEVDPPPAPPKPAEAPAPKTPAAPTIEAPSLTAPPTMPAVPTPLLPTPAPAPAPKTEETKPAPTPAPAPAAPAPATPPAAEAPKS